MPVIEESFAPVYPGDLPPELWMYVLSFLDFDEFARIGQASRTMYVVTHDPYLVKQVASTTVDGRHLFHRGLWKPLVAWMKNYEARMETLGEKCRVNASDLESSTEAHSKLVMRRKRSRKPDTLAKLDAEIASLKRKIQRFGKASRDRDTLELAWNEVYGMMRDLPSFWVADPEHCDIPTPELWKELLDLQENRLDLSSEKARRGVACWRNQCHMMFAIMTADAPQVVDILASRKLNNFDIATDAILASDSLAIIEELKKRPHVMIHAKWRHLKWGLKEALDRRTHVAHNFNLFLFESYAFVDDYTLDQVGIEAVMDRIALAKLDDLQEFTHMLFERGNEEDLLYAFEVSEPVRKACKYQLWSYQHPVIFTLSVTQTKAKLLSWIISSNSDDAEYTMRKKNALQECVDAGVATWGDILGFAKYIGSKIQVTKWAGDALPLEAARAFVEKLFMEDASGYVKDGLALAARTDGIDPRPLFATTKINMVNLTPVLRMVHPRHFECIMTHALKAKHKTCARTILNFGYMPTDAQWATVRSFTTKKDKGILNMFIECQNRVVYK